MKTYDSIEKGIAKKDIASLREAIGSICYTGSNFDKELLDVINYVVNEKAVNIKDPFLKGKLISKGKNEYTDDDFSDAVFELKENFCDERIQDVITIGKYLYGRNVSKNIPTDSGHVENSMKKETTQKEMQDKVKDPNHESRPLNMVLTAAIIVVVILIVLKVIK